MSSFHSLPVAPFDALVFAGGGCRCFWQAGFVRGFQRHLQLAPEAVSGVSAGASFACVALSGIDEDVMMDFAERASANGKNAHWNNLLSKTEPVFPQERIFRDTILAHMDASLLAKLRAGPEIRVLLGHPPGGRPNVPILLAGLIAYRFDKRWRQRLHVSMPRRLGFTFSVARVQDCRTPLELAALLLQTSCTPPVTSRMQRDKRWVIDGGLIDSVPVALVPEAHHALILLTAPHPTSHIPRLPGRTYISPASPSASHRGTTRAQTSFATPTRKALKKAKRTEPAVKRRRQILTESTTCDGERHGARFHHS